MTEAALAQQLIEDYGEAPVALASLLHLTTYALSNQGGDPSQTLGPLLRLQRHCVDTWAAAHDIEVGRIDAALRALKGRTPTRREGRGGPPGGCVVAIQQGLPGCPVVAFRDATVQ